MDKPLEIPGAPSREIKATLAGAGIREMMELAATLEDVIHLELGEPDFPTPSHVIDAVERALHTGRVRYTLPRGEPGLRDILAEKLRARNGIPTDSDRVVVTNGGTSAVFAALMAVVSLGDGVLIPDPGWPTFATATELVGGRLLRYRLTPSRTSSRISTSSTPWRRMRASLSSTAHRIRPVPFCRAAPWSISSRSLTGTASPSSATRFTRGSCSTARP